jgi:hypothetical protein
VLDSAVSLSHTLLVSRSSPPSKTSLRVENFHYVPQSFSPQNQPVSMASTITPAPTLEKRDSYVWGYVNGDSSTAHLFNLYVFDLSLTDSPLSCPGDLTPTLVANYGNYIGCCDQASCVNAWRMCNPYLGTLCPEPNICSEIYTSYLQWCVVP